MKSNIGRGQNNEKGKKQKGKKQITLNSMSVVDRNNKFSAIVKREFENLIEVNGEEEIREIFEYMMSEEFAMKFVRDKHKGNKKIIKDTRAAINLNVKNLIMRYYEQELQSLVEKGLKSGISRREVIAKMQNNRYIKELLEKEKITDDVELAVSRQIKKCINEQMDLIEQEDENFVAIVSKYTDGYRLLAQERYLYTGINGNTNKSKECKFENIDQYYRFKAIQKKIKQEMKFTNGDEAEAIKMVIKKSDGRLSKAELTILEKRMERILHPNTFELDGVEL